MPRPSLFKPDAGAPRITNAAALPTQVPPVKPAYVTWAAVPSLYELSLNMHAPVTVPVEALRLLPSKTALPLTVPKFSTGAATTHGSTPTSPVNNALPVIVPELLAAPTAPACDPINSQLPVTVTPAPMRELVKIPL